MGVEEGDEKAEDPLELSAATRLGQEAADLGSTRPATLTIQEIRIFESLFYKVMICVYPPTNKSLMVESVRFC